MVISYKLYDITCVTGTIYVPYEIYYTSHNLRLIRYVSYASMNYENPYCRKIQNMVDKLKIFLAEEVPKIFSDSDYETHENCGNYIGFLQEVR